MSFFSSVLGGLAAGVGGSAAAGSSLGEVAGDALGAVGGQLASGEINRYQQGRNIDSNFAAFKRAGLTPQESVGSVGNAGAGAAASATQERNQALRIKNKELDLQKRGQDLAARTQLGVAQIQSDTSRYNVGQQVQAPRRQAQTAERQFQHKRSIDLQKLPFELQQAKQQNATTTQRWHIFMKKLSMGPENVANAVEVNRLETWLREKYGFSVDLVRGTNLDRISPADRKRVVHTMVGLSSVANKNIQGIGRIIDEVAKGLGSDQPSWSPTPHEKKETKPIYYPTQPSKRKGKPN